MDALKDGSNQLGRLDALLHRLAQLTYRVEQGNEAVTAGRDHLAVGSPAAGT